MPTRENKPHTLEKTASADTVVLRLQVWVDIRTNILVYRRSEIEGTLKDNVVYHPYFPLDKSEWVSGLPHNCLGEEIT